MHKTRAGSWLFLAGCVFAGCLGPSIVGWAGQAAPPQQPAAKKPAAATGKKAPAPAHPPAAKPKLAAAPAKKAAAPRKQAAVPAKPAAPPAKQAAAPAKKPAAPPKAVKPAQAPPRRAAKPAPEAKPKAALALPKKEEKAAPPVSGRRDPFKVPVLMTGGGESGAATESTGPLPAGNRGLIISQLQLEGIVRLDTSNTMIAVVTNFRKLAYFLKENDPLYNGVVSKITPDAVYFKENHLDQNGRVTTVDVVKRLSPAPGEGK